MIERNGVQIFEPGESPPIPEGLRDDFQVISPFGFKVVMIDGTPYWQAGTKEDYCKAEAQLLGISVEESAKRLDERTEEAGRPICYQVGPKECRGSCYDIGQLCVLIYIPQSQYYMCACR